MSAIGAGLQSFMGAPRLLQAMANDGVLSFMKYLVRSSYQLLHLNMMTSDHEPQKCHFPSNDVETWLSNV